MAKDWLIESDRNIFLTGKAGTGKSYRINLFNEFCKKTNKTVILCAPTGTAAVNIGGDTAHRIFNIPVNCIGAKLPPLTDKKHKQVLNMIAKADVIIIDEISMLRNDAFVYLIKVIKRAEKIKGKKIRIIVTGDYLQIPPVVTKTDAVKLEKAGLDPSGYAFTTKEWKALNFKVVELTKIYRQKDDKEFAEQLGKVRIGDESCISYFWQFVDKKYNINPSDEDTDTVFIPNDEYIYVCGTNAKADLINKHYMCSLSGSLCAYEADKKGRIYSDVAPDVLLLKMNARVMFTVNDPERKFVNGTMGYVTALTGDSVTVKTDEGKTIKVERYDFKTYSYSDKGGKLTKNEVGCISQIPLKVAKAITIHKSQGKTFEKVIVSPDCFAPGQIYVALSRVTSAKGLILTEEILPEHFKDNFIVEEFLENGYTYEIKPVKKAPAVKKKTIKKTKSKSNVKKPVKRKTTKKTTKSVKKKPVSKSAKGKITTVKKKAKTGVKKAATKTVAKKKSVTKKTAAKKPVKRVTKTTTKRTPVKSSSKTTRNSSKSKTKSRKTTK